MICTAGCTKEVAPTPRPLEQHRACSRALPSETAGATAHDFSLQSLAPPPQLHLANLAGAWLALLTQGAAAPSPTACARSPPTAARVEGGEHSPQQHHGRVETNPHWPPSFSWPKDDHEPTPALLQERNVASLQEERAQLRGMSAGGREERMSHLHRKCSDLEIPVEAPPRPSLRPV